MASPAKWSCHSASSLATFCGVMRDEYSDRKLFLGMALRPQKRASPSSATSAIMWLLRSMDHSLSASEARSAKRMRGRDHAGTGKPGAERQRVGVETQQIGNE